MKVDVDISTFRTNIRAYALLVGKNIKDAIKEEARLICQRVMQFTPPRNLAQGRRRVKSDIERVYLMPSWFEETFAFQYDKLGNRVKELVRTKQEETLDKIFERSDKLRRIHMESFSPDTHRKARRAGRVGKGFAPFSFPLREQERVKAYSSKKQKNVGLVKSGWAACLIKLGGSAPGWLAKRSGNGQVRYLSDGIEMINTIKIAKQVDAKGGFIRKALAGRQRDLARKIDAAIRGTRWGK